jgi:arylesterase/paraoxonase
MALDPARRQIFISSLDRRTKNARGAVHLFFLDDPLNADGWRDRTGGAPEAFRPLGMDYYEDADVRRLFVVNEANRAVELFDIGEKGDLIHIETFAERRLTSPNNVAAVGPREFYVTNDVKAGKHTILGLLQFLTRSRAGQILFSDGNVWRVAAEELRFANGVETDAGGKRLYVSETTGRAVRVFERDLETNALTQLDVISLEAAPDNIAVDGAGLVWIAALPKPLAVPRHGADPRRIAPSQIIRIGFDGAPRTIYRDDGKEISASTSVVRLGHSLLIGALYDDRFLICELPEGAI